ncbi:MAG: hypothetical protein KC457_35930, partial [Myxococcales bacterium]|nr:hypothetical protein [Myxococcales bacterium]
PDGVQFCDRLDAPNTSPDWLGPGWYRIDGWANFVAFSPGPDYSCGTSAGGWVNGLVPSVEDGPTPVEMCFAFGGDDCAWSVEATFINCYLDPHILWLPEVPDCDLGYCTIQIIPD